MDEGATLTMNVRGSRLSFTAKTMSCGTKPVPLSSALENFEVLVDRASVETFANNGEAAMSKCFLPSENGLSLRAAGGRVTLNRLKLVYLKSAWRP
jgi:sucrose-6-phosphate hydrolase SacC (GH32 family)